MNYYFTKNHKKAEEFFKSKISFEISPYELKDTIEKNINTINIIDVRKYEDYIEERIPYAIHIPYETFKQHLKMLEKDKINIIYCYSQYCKLAHKAACLISEEDYPAMVLMGGFNIWKKSNFDTVSDIENK